MKLRPGKIGIYLADYRDAYGEALGYAIRAFNSHAMAQAKTRFEEAITAGLTFDDDSFVQPMWATCLYYSGDIENAKRQMQLFADRSPGGPGWHLLAQFFGGAVSHVPHLCLHASDQSFRESDDAQYLVNTARYLTVDLARHPEAIRHAAQASRMSSPPKLLGGLLHAQQYAFSALGADSETLELVQRTKGDEGAIGYWGYAAFFAEKNGRPELAMDMARGLFDAYRARGNGQLWASESLRLHLRVGQIEAAQNFVENVLDDDERRAMLGWRIPLGYD